MKLEDFDLPPLGTKVWVLQACRCVAERKRCNPDYLPTIKVKEVIPISEKKYSPPYDNTKTYTNKQCWRLYEREFKQHHIAQWGTYIFASKEEALARIEARKKAEKDKLLKRLNTCWNSSEYTDANETTGSIYYFQERRCEPGNIGYLYSIDDDEISKLRIVNCIARSENPKEYDNYNEDILLDMEDLYEADTSCEFITDKDCYLVVFKYA